MLDLSKNVDRNFYLDAFEVQNFQLLGRILKRGMCVIDVGANIGLYTLLFCKMVGDEGNVYSFEPAPQAYSRLKLNVDLNHFANAKLFNMGVSESTGKRQFYMCEDDAYNSLGSKPMMPIKQTIEIPTTTLDEFCLQEGIRRVDLIKIDAEGADLLIIKGAAKLLASESAPIILCEYNRLAVQGFDFAIGDLYTHMIKTGYELYEVKNQKLHKFDIVQSKASDVLCIKERHRHLFAFAE